MSKVVKPPYWKKINFSHPLARGLVGCWLFNEGIGNTVNDLSGNNNHGIVSGATWASGKHGSALLFNGATDYVKVTYSDSLGPRGIRFSIACWIYPMGYGGAGYGRVVDMTGGDSDKNFMIIMSSIYPSQLRFYFRSGHQLLTLLQLNSWNMCVFTYDDVSILGKAKVESYIHGVNYTYYLHNAGINPAEADFYIGNNLGGARGFDGYISDIRFYNCILSAEEVAWLYREPYAMFA